MLNNIRQLGIALVLAFCASFAVQAATLPNGGKVSGVIVTSAQVSHTFTANAGENIWLRIVDTGNTSFQPRMAVYGPTGTKVADNWDSSVAKIEYTVPTSGTYTVVVSDTSGLYSGSYDLYYVKLPGANDSGGLTNGGKNSGVIDLGDLDTFTITVTAGENIWLRIVDTGNTSFQPRMAVYGPTGTKVADNWDSSVAKIEYTVPTSGTYTVVVSDTSGLYSGSYDLYYVKLPGANDSGSLTNGGKNSGVIDLGDLDTFTITVTAGENIWLRIVDTGNTSFQPRMAVYGPTGTKVADNWDSSVAKIEYTVPTSGTYTVVVSDTSGLYSGSYDLYYVKLPGANELGALYDGEERAEVIELGDLDTYTFSASAGTSIQLLITDTSGGSLQPRVTLYGPTGQKAADNWGSTNATIAVTLASSGTYHVVASDNSGLYTGGYAIKLTGAGGTNPNGSGSNGDAPIPLWALALLAGLFGHGLRRVRSSG